MEVEPREASELIKRTGSVLIDVREPAEFATAKVPGSRLIPMQWIPAELQSIEGLADGGDLFFLCHHGVRSLQVVSWLRDHGVENCYSVSGGIDRWSAEIDTSIPRY
jgi:rhodanese-related sulfurtransferase